MASQRESHRTTGSPQFTRGPCSKAHSYADAWDLEHIHLNHCWIWELGSPASPQEHLLRAVLVPDGLIYSKPGFSKGVGLRGTSGTKPCPLVPHHLRSGEAPVRLQACLSLSQVGSCLLQIDTSLYLGLSKAGSRSAGDLLVLQL